MLRGHILWECMRTMRMMIGNGRIGIEHLGLAFVRSSVVLGNGRIKTSGSGPGSAASSVTGQASSAMIWSRVVRLGWAAQGSTLVQLMRTSSDHDGQLYSTI